ncbi:FUSC family protein [Azotobacter beijerinckii]|uniref:Fusaric acid resistance protein-like n=1 Tax=Azotobacter beijerinckii TaxID=170623 RepID=A0A1I4CUS0_9GAMM|nr:FUSC family protein [Azotobacter beijerinckii]SFK85002.1 Fusaric acid resistance protein-like [Azotobacter beijerinckii]
MPTGCRSVAWRSFQGASLQAVWNRQLHRVLGTSVGLLVAWGLLLLPLDKWSIALTLMVLCFVIETAVVRHYGFAVIFVTPLTILLAEAATLGQGSATALIGARFVDTVLGCLVGLLGGVCLHSPRFREAVGRPMRRLVPERFGE